jgi:uncharacterized repeat protein (TIGR03803 family)
MKSAPRSQVHVSRSTFHFCIQAAALSIIANVARGQATLPTNILYSFTGAGGVGVLPEGALLQSGSEFYGLTVSGGINNNGTLFQFDPANKIKQQEKRKR